MIRTIGRVILAVVAASMLSLAVVKIIDAFKDINAQLAKKPYFTETLSADDSSLFKSSAWASLKVKQVFHLEDQNPLSFLSYKEAFDLALYKFAMKENPEVSKVLSFEEKWAGMSTGVSYVSLPLGDFLTYEFVPEAPRNISSLHVTLNGNSLNVDSSDASMTFRFFCKNFSIRCDSFATTQACVTGQEGLLAIIVPTPLELKFLSRGKFIYMVVLTAKAKTNEIIFDELKTILK